MNNLITRTVSGIFFVAVMVGATLRRQDLYSPFRNNNGACGVGVLHACKQQEGTASQQTDKHRRRPVPVSCNDVVLHGCVGSGNIHYLITLMYLLIAGLCTALAGKLGLRLCLAVVHSPSVALNVLAFRMKTLGLRLCLPQLYFGPTFRSRMMNVLANSLCKAVVRRRRHVGNVAHFYVHASAMGGHGARGSGVRLMGRWSFGNQRHGTWRSARPFRQRCWPSRPLCCICTHSK